MPSLSGKNTLSQSIHLSGKGSSSFSKDLPLEIKLLKSRILNQFLLPLFSQQWETLYQNVLFLDVFQQKIRSYSHISSWREELAMYSEMLELLEKVLEDHRQLEEIERKTYTGIDKEVMSFVYKTTAIRLKPEYEIYDVVFGKPQREKSEVYKEEILQDIRLWLTWENPTFTKIKESLMKKYG
jgi:hypothetical protein